MAEGLVNHLLADSWQASSAGTEPAPQGNPFAAQALDELGIDVTAHSPKHVDEFRGQAFDVVITLCDQAADTCPAWLGSGQVEHIGLPDPAAAAGTDAERLEAFRRARDYIRERVLGYLETFDPEVGERSAEPEPEESGLESLT